MTCCGFDDNSAGVAVPLSRAISGAYISPASMNFAAGTIAITINTMYLLPYNMTGTFDALAIQTTIGSVAGSVRLGLYRADPLTGHPTTLLLDNGSQVTTGVGLIASTFSNLYIGEPLWAAAIFDVACTTNAGGAASQAGNPVLGASAINAATANGSITAAMAFGALPADLSATAFAYQLATMTPMVALRAA